MKSYIQGLITGIYVDVFAHDYYGFSKTFFKDVQNETPGNRK